MRDAIGFIASRDKKGPAAKILNLPANSYDYQNLDIAYQQPSKVRDIRHKYVMFKARQAMRFTKLVKMG